MISALGHLSRNPPREISVNDLLIKEPGKTAVIIGLLTIRRLLDGEDVELENAVLMPDSNIHNALGQERAVTEDEGKKPWPSHKTAEEKMPEICGGCQLFPCKYTGICSDKIETTERIVASLAPRSFSAAVPRYGKSPLMHFIENLRVSPPVGRPVHFFGDRAQAEAFAAGRINPAAAPRKDRSIRIKRGNFWPLTSDWSEVKKGDLLRFDDEPGVTYQAKNDAVFNPGSGWRLRADLVAKEKWIFVI